MFVSKLSGTLIVLKGPKIMINSEFLKKMLMLYILTRIIEVGQFGDINEFS